MGDLVLTDPYVSLGGTDYSASVRQITIPNGAELLDGTRGGDDTRRNIGGLKTWSMEIEFVQDFDNAAIDDDLFAKNGTTIAVEVRPTTAAVGPNNPKLTGNGVLHGYPPLGQQMGELVTATASIASAGTLSRAEA